MNHWPLKGAPFHSGPSSAAKRSLVDDWVGKNDPFRILRQAVNGVLLDSTATGIQGKAAGHWPFTEVPFSFYMC